MFDKIIKCQNRCGHQFIVKEFKYIVNIPYYSRENGEKVFLLRQKIICKHCYHKIGNRIGRGLHKLKLVEII